EGTPQWGIRTSRLRSGHAHLQHRGPRRDGTSRTSREGQRKNEPAPPGRPQSDTDAKNIEARRRISLSSRSRLTSDFRRLISADCSVVTPGRVPSSTSAWASQRRTASRETPSWRATAAVAAVGVGYCWACARTSRTHLARSWESIFHGCLSILSDSNSSGIKPGPIHIELPGVEGAEALAHADLVVDCVGAPSAALAHVQTGGVLGLLGTGVDAPFLSGLEVHRRNITVVGMHELSGMSVGDRGTAFHMLQHWIRRSGVESRLERIIEVFPGSDAPSRYLDSIGGGVDLATVSVLEWQR